MAWPDTILCTGCKEVFKKEDCTIDIGDFWNNGKGYVFACSKKCAEDAKKNWLKKT